MKTGAVTGAVTGAEQCEDRSKDRSEDRSKDRSEDRSKDRSEDRGGAVRRQERRQEPYSWFTNHLRLFLVILFKMSDTVELKYDGRSYEMSLTQLRTTNIGLVFGVSI